MKSLLVSTLLLATTGLLASDPAPGPQQEVIAKLPAYSSAEHERLVAAEEAVAKAQAEAQAAAEADPDTVVLPPMTVLEKAMLRMEEDSLYRKGAFDEELVKRELTAFDRHFLNRYTLPIIGESKAARAREAYLRRRNEELQARYARLAALVAVDDPAEAAAFREDLLDTGLAAANETKEALRSTSAKGGSGGKDTQ